MITMKQEARNFFFFFFFEGIVSRCIHDFVLFIICLEKNFSEGYYFELCLWFCFYPPGKIFSEGYCFQLCLWFFTARKIIFPKVLFSAASVILFYYRPEKNFSQRYCFQLRLWLPPGKEFFWRYCFQSRLWFCRVFFFFFSVTTIALGRLKQFEPNFHTWLLSRIARASS